MSRVFHRIFRIWQYVSCVLLLAVSAQAQSWNATVPDIPQTPPRVVIVEKADQRLALLGKQSPLSVLQSYACTTGKVSGPKHVQNDLRTPEGVYFVVNKIDRGLDFQEYGGIAYTLNYPNPVDVLREKTGYGIWIHSRGHPISPMSTRGCVAVNLDAIEVLGPQLKTGTAVVLAERVTTTDASASSAPESAIARILEDKTRKWNSSWAGRSSDMFSLYNAEAYSKAQRQSFSAFRAQKERLFAILPWIHIIYRDIHVLQGPDYWVTWFEQYYRAPNITTEGVRRLYWQPDADGELRIVGMEWLPQNLGLEAAYLDTITPGVMRFVEEWRAQWLKADADAYGALYTRDARQGNLRGSQQIVQAKRAIWGWAKPARVDLTGVRVMLEKGGVKVDMTQVYRDSSGKGDKGVKTLLLYPHGETWRIESEVWSALTQ